MALCAKLLAEGVTVYAVTHPGSARAALLPQDARLHVVPCDAAELAALPELIPEKANAFFHFARSARPPRGHTRLGCQPR